MPQPCARARGHGRLRTSRNPHAVRPAEAEAPTAQDQMQATGCPHIARYRCSRIPHLSALPASGFATLVAPGTSRQALQPAAKPRRNPVAASAAEHLAQERVSALPLAAAGVFGVLDLVPQLRCADTGRTARERRPASLSMAVDAVSGTRSDHLRCRGRGRSRSKRGACCWRGGK
jgi:hypothetical protein